MSNDDSIREVIRHYVDVDESSRLRAGWFQLEKARTRELILRHLPAAPAMIIDAGGNDPQQRGGVLGASSHIMVHRAKIDAAVSAPAVSAPNNRRLCCNHGGSSVRQLSNQRIHQSHQVVPTHANQFAMRARAESNLLVFGEPRIRIHGHVVEIPERWHRARLAIGESVFEFLLRSDLDVRAPVRLLSRSRSTCSDAGTTAIARMPSIFTITVFASFLPDTWVSAAIPW